MRSMNKLIYIGFFIIVALLIIERFWFSIPDIVAIILSIIGIAVFGVGMYLDRKQKGGCKNK